MIMRSVRRIASVAAGLMLLGGLAFGQESRMITPGTPEAAQALQQLRTARSTDVGNSKSFSDSDNSLDHYYARKAREVDSLIQRLKQGQPISMTEMSQALNTNRAENYAPLY